MAEKIWSYGPIKEDKEARAKPTTDEAIQLLNKYKDTGWEPYIYEDFGDWYDDDDLINSPKHYSDKEIEVIDYIDDTVPDSYSYCFGNAIKYLSRHLKKGKPVQDLEKCIWYINKMIEDNK